MTEPSTNGGGSETPERDKFMAWYNDQRKNHGLLHLDIFPGDLNGATAEDIYRAMNEMNQAVSDGRYTIATDL